MKVKTSELTGQTLDWAVAKAVGARMNWHAKAYRPSSAWAFCGPLIEKFSIWTSDDDGEFLASCKPHMGNAIQKGPTPQIAICRAVVTSVLGDEIELPAELFKQEPEKP